MQKTFEQPRRADWVTHKIFPLAQSLLHHERVLSSFNDPSRSFSSCPDQQKCRIFDDSILLHILERRIVPMADVFLSPLHYTFNEAGGAFLSRTSCISSFPGGIHAHRTLLHDPCCHAQLCSRGSFRLSTGFAPWWLGTL